MAQLTEAVWVVEGQHCGTSKIPLVTAWGITRSRSVAYFCPMCCRVWATVKYDTLAKFSVQHMGCKDCPVDYEGEVPGALWISYDKQQNAAMPARAVQREFELTLAHFERRNHLDSAK